jgi:hypothetical protein
VTKCFLKAGFGMASSSISLMPDEDVHTTCLNDIIYSTQLIILSRFTSRKCLCAQSDRQNFPAL